APRTGCGDWRRIRLADEFGKWSWSMKDGCRWATPLSGILTNVSIAAPAKLHARQEWNTASSSKVHGPKSSSIIGGIFVHAIRGLTANGCEVVVPAGQLCCGALAAHAGIRDVARQLARVNLGVFLSEDFDAVVTNAAGCGSTLKEYDQLFAADDPEHARARE